MGVHTGDSITVAPAQTLTDKEYQRMRDASLAIIREIVKRTGFPAILRPSFTLGGTGGSIAWKPEEYDALVEWALQSSPRHTCLIEQSVLGWKEYELEVMRDTHDNVVIIC